MLLDVSCGDVALHCGCGEEGGWNVCASIDAQGGGGANFITFDMQAIEGGGDDRLEGCVGVGIDVLAVDCGVGGSEVK